MHVIFFSQNDINITAVTVDWSIISVTNCNLSFENYCKCSSSAEKRRNSDTTHHAPTLSIFSSSLSLRVQYLYNSLRSIDWTATFACRRHAIAQCWRFPRTSTSQFQHRTTS
ncbi:unnamed protein product [Periconia digitata]|uniref:Uncharacterized protein n=1 Tax=Periconia digitata TaxID=1303443 RepID=A0A9W4XGK7_9PLEO|nr:unnamed protein product [Periconia digitata]